MRIVFFGASKFVLPLLDVLRTNYDLQLVVTTESDARQPVSSYARKNSIELLAIKKPARHALQGIAGGFIDQTIEKIKAVGAPVGILAYLGIILPSNILTIFPQGVINIHPSLLPKYRGPTPGQSAILAGDSQTGVSLIRLDDQVDHGPILAFATDAILPTDTSESLYEQLFRRGAELLNIHLNDYVKQATKLTPQDDSKATFTQQLTRESGYFDIQNPPDKEQLNRMIRAYYPWPGVWTKLKVENGKLKIVKFLPEHKIQVEGKKPLTYKDFINGYPSTKTIMDKLLIINSSSA